VKLANAVLRCGSGQIVATRAAASGFIDIRLEQRGLVGVEIVLGETVSVTSALLMLATVPPALDAVAQTGSPMLLLQTND
jgi:hypothetical protein